MCVALCTFVSNMNTASRTAYYELRHATGPFPVSPATALAGEDVCVFLSLKLSVDQSSRSCDLKRQVVRRYRL